MEEEEEEEEGEGEEEEEEEEEVEEKEEEEENVDKVEDDNIIYNIGNTCSTHVCTCRYP